MIGRLLRLATAATLAAGIVGVARHRRESLAVRRGELPPASAASDVAPIASYGRLAAGLSEWVPERPATAAGRLASFVWASPLTAVGLALAGLAGAHPAWDETLGCWVARGARGPSRVALRAVGASANAVGHVVLALKDDPSDTLLAHEAVHVRQAERLGPLMLPLYLWLSARYGYRDHPLERAARRGARRSVEVD